MKAANHADAPFLESIRAAAAIAEDYAIDVDRDARFPCEAIASLRKSGVLGAAVAAELGGDGVSFAALCTACFELSRRCASTGMIFAMHQIQIASIGRHLSQSHVLRTYLTDIARNGRLVASVTSEVGAGGDLRLSNAFLELLDDGKARFEKTAPTVSFGAYADDLLITLRRSRNAAPNDQILVLVRGHQATMQQTDGWDALGLRGTASPGFKLRAELSADQVVPAPFAVIASETMIPYAHILWAFCWLGIATDAAERARDCVKARWRASFASTIATARLSQMSTELWAMRAAIHGARDEFELLRDIPKRDELSTLSYALRINNLKIVASEATVGVCLKALDICGLAGYKNSGRFSVGRNLRDALSAPLMISNDRIHASNTHLLLMTGGA